MWKFLSLAFLVSPRIRQSKNVISQDLPSMSKMSTLNLFALVSASLFILLMVPSCANTEINQFKFEGDPLNIASGENVGIIKPETLIKVSHPVQLVAWNPDGKHVAVTGRTPEISVWDIEKRQLVMSLRKPRAGAHSSIAYSPDGRYLASGASVISVWDAKTGAFLRDIVGPYIDMTRPQPIGVQSISFSPDGGTIAVTYSSIGRGFAICLFESENGKLIRSIESEGITDTGVVFSQDGKRLFGTRFYSSGERDPSGLPVTYLDENTEIGMWDALSGQKMGATKNVHVMGPTAFAVSPDNGIFATGSWTGNIESTRNMKTGEFRTIKNNDPIRLWDAKTGHLRTELAVSSRVNSLAFSPDENLLISCQVADPTIQNPIWLWRVSTGKLIQKIKFPKNRDTPSCAFSPDGTRLAATIGFDLAIYSVGR